MIGKIEKVPLRQIWKHEAHDFTTWLEENLEVLNEVLDFDLSNPSREQSTGNFNVDIVAEDSDGEIVVIENQLEKSNHDHLGKIVTYLSAVGASKAIWIVSEPRAEHVKAISWLNESTSADFYLFKIEGIKIANSLPAPLLTKIVGPSEEVKSAGATKKELSERHHLRKEFWEFHIANIKGKTNLHANLTPNIYSWIGTGSGISGVTYNYSIGQHDARVELYIDKDKEDGEGNKLLFDKLFNEKENIENAFGETLIWERLDNKRASRISFYVDIGGYKDKDKLQIVSDMMIDRMILLEKALSPELKKINR